MLRKWIQCLKLPKMDGRIYVCFKFIMILSEAVRHCNEIVVCDSGDLDLILWEIPFTPV